MKKIERFTDKEWEELASILSDEKDEVRSPQAGLWLRISMIPENSGKI